MSFRKLLSQIVRGTWAIHPKIAIGYGDFVANLINGTAIAYDDEPSLEIRIISPTGNIDTFNIKGGQDKDSDGKPISIYDNVPGGSTAIIPLKGEMLKENSLSSFGTVSIASFIREAANHKNISSIIIETDSGGGAIDAVPPMIDAINFARTKGPVIGLADMAASAAYWSLTATNEIIADNDISAEFGSIGVMISFADVRPMWEKEGVKFHKIYAPESDHKNLEFEKALKGDYDLIKSELLSPLARRFQKSVRNNRSGKIDITVKGILNGKIFFADKAKQHGLIDSIGNLDFAIQRAVEMANK